MIYLVILVAAIVIVWNVRNNSKLKAEVAKLKAEAAPLVGKAESAVLGEVKKVLQSVGRTLVRIQPAALKWTEVAQWIERPTTISRSGKHQAMTGSAPVA